MDRHVAIVGSRRRATLTDREIVLHLVKRLAGSVYDITIVSGGCPKSADEFAEEAAKIYGVPTLIFPIDKEGITARWQFTQRAHARNRKVAEASDILFCLVHESRTGGTENTIKHALELKKEVYLVNEKGEIYLSTDGSYPKCAPWADLLDSNSTG